MRWSLAWIILVSTVSVMGCRNRATPLSNPFLAPDRVPPPGTRNLVPGTAVPYYHDSEQVAPAVAEPISDSFQPRSEIVPAGTTGGSVHSGRTPGTRLAQAAGTGDRVAGDRVAIPADDRRARVAVAPRIMPPVAEPPATGIQAAIAQSPEPTPQVRVRGLESGATRRSTIDIFQPERTAIAASATHDPNSTRWSRPSVVHEGNEISNQTAIRQATPRYYAAPPDPPEMSARGAPVMAAPVRQAANILIPGNPCQNMVPGEVWLGSGPVGDPMDGYIICNPQPFPASVQAVEIGELPLANEPARRRQRSQGTSSRTSPAESGAGLWSRTSHSDESVLPASYIEADRSPSERSNSGIQLLRSTADATPRTWARYGFEPNYTLLKGRLEQSAVTGQWKLRYIPIDGTTDEFGGSVVIENPQLLHAYQPGDFVEIRGAMDRHPSDDLSFAARYRVASIQPLAE